MKKLFTLFLFCLPLAAQAPTKLFDVKNGNGIVDAGVTQAQATYIVYKDAAAKGKIIDSFCAAYGYQATVPDPNNPGQTIPNPQSKQAFFNATITAYIRGVHKSQVENAAADAARKTAGDGADAELPTIIKP